MVYMICTPIRTKTEDDVADGYNLVALTNLPTLIAERQQSGSELVIRLLPTDSLKGLSRVSC